MLMESNDKAPYRRGVLLGPTLRSGASRRIGRSLGYRGRFDCGCETGASGIQRDSESEPTGAVHHLGVRYDCRHGGRGCG
jgi:hypothetical protein